MSQARVMARCAKIGYAYVVADLIHVGHLNHLETCKALCDHLVVGVLSDQAVLERKPPPTIPFEQRLRMVAALRCVDAVVPQETYSPLSNAIAMGASILFESTSHSELDIKEASTVMSSHGGATIVLPYYPTCSSTKIKDDIRATATPTASRIANHQSG